MSDLESRFKDWDRAKKAWDACNSQDITKHIRAGEDLYFAGQLLIDALSRQRPEPTDA